MDWFRTVGLGTFIVGIWFIAGTSQQAYADNIFTDSFVVDPTENGWGEKMVQVDGPQFPSTATGDITSDEVDAVLLKKQGIGALELSISQTFSTLDYEDISVKLAAFQTMEGYEWPDYVRIEYDIGDGVLVTLLEDHQVWNGVHDMIGENPEGSALGNTLSTPTQDLALPDAASNNEFLTIRLSVLIDATTNTIFFDNFELNGDPFQQNNPDAFDLLEELFDLVNNLESSEIKNSGSLVSQAANLLEMLEGADKETHALFIERFHEFKDLLKEKLGKGKQQGSFENKIMGNNLDKMELKLKMQSSKILEDANKTNKIQTATDLSIQKKDLIKTKNRLAIAQLLPKSPEKDKLVEQLELEKIELLKRVLILDAKHNDKKITTDFLKKLDEKITEETDGKKSQNNKKQDDKSNNSKKSDNKNKGSSSKSKSKNK